MKRNILASLLLFVIALTASAQEQQNKRPHFSPEEFQAKQRAYITDKAGLSPEEAEAFFPLFFELQKKKFELERNARKDFKRQRGERMSEDECRKFVYNMADVKIEVAKLEREYTDKYLEVLPACKVRRVQHAENSFQRHLMKEMMEHRNNRPE
ncbi:MAG: hypothetical protein IIW75_08970 [Bacteroidaceae bacterium]|nr:hypothetical protein [Bacteroidaceae bacterium]